jgi:hypothetical protein
MSIDYIISFFILIKNIYYYSFLCILSIAVMAEVLSIIFTKLKIFVFIYTD